jgi:ABC-type lipoprotein export system ATPase subunit
MAMSFGLTEERTAAPNQSEESALGFRLDKLSFAYPRKNRPPQVILNDLNFTLPLGRSVAILGLSGLGKTTLLNLLGLLWDRKLQRRADNPGAVKETAGPTVGHALQWGRISYRPRTGPVVHYDELPPHACTRLRGTEFGFVPQKTHFLTGFRCKHNLRLPLLMQGWSEKEADARIQDLLREALGETHEEGGAGADLAALLGRYPDEVSTGQLQRLSVLRSMIHDPPVLFADEPVSNLDVVNKRLILDLFRRWRENQLPGQAASARTLLLVCHEAETAWEVAAKDDDQFLFLHPSQSKEQPGARGELISRQDFRAMYGLDPTTADADLTGALAIRRHIEKTGVR